MRALILGLALLLSGCVSAKEALEAMGKDQATICVTVMSVYGSIKAFRTNLQSGTVTCDPDKMTVTPAK